MKVRYAKKENLTTGLVLVGLLSVPLLVVKDRIKKIRLEESEKKTIERIVRNTLNLEKNLTNDKVEKYIEFVRNLSIPNKMVCKNIILNGYDLIKSNSNIDENLKKQFRIILEVKGFKMIY